MNILFKTKVRKDLNSIKEGFNQELFLKLGPPGVKFKLERFDGCKKGDEIHLGIYQLGVIKQRWISFITEDKHREDEWYFIDEGKLLPWPLSYWKHRHRVIRINDLESEIVDDITYECKPRILGKIIYPAMWALFAIRPSRYKEFFEV